MLICVAITPSTHLGEQFIYRLPKFFYALHFKTQADTPLNTAAFVPFVPWLPVGLGVIYQDLTHIIKSTITGRVVRVPFGKKTLTGVALGLGSSDLPSAKIRDIAQISAFTLPKISLDFAYFLADYYHGRLGDALGMMLPKDAGALFKADYFAHQKPNSAHQDDRNHNQNHDHPKATKEQQNALNALYHAQNKGGYHAFLLDGVTGSGKTHIYLNIAKSVLTHGKQVLVLVPEIGLTAQTLARFSEKFGDIVLIHSKISQKARAKIFFDIAQNRAKIIIGTRSALLYPFADLGQIIIDEAHDSAYKQGEGVRYHAVFAAMWLARALGIGILMGTATPSLELIKLCDDGKITPLYLKNRAVGALKMALVSSDDTPFFELPTGERHRALIFAKTHEKITQTLEDGKQVLVFLNRRGFAPVLFCHACHWYADCPQCHAHLTLHPDKMRCHHCDYRQKIPTNCPDCQSQNLVSVGAGTAKLTAELHARYTNPQTRTKTYPIIQIDRDTIKTQKAWARVRQTISTGAPMILVGTQMLAKGHHFDGVALVVIADSDFAFFAPDFRAAEYAAQTIVQVAGRAGRAGMGLCLIQTQHADNPLLLALVGGGYGELARRLLGERKMLNLPPFSHHAIVRLSSVHQKALEQHQSSLVQELNHHPITVRAVTPSPDKIAGRHQRLVWILANARAPLNAALYALSAPPSSVRQVIDKDAMSF